MHTTCFGSVNDTKLSTPWASARLAEPVLPLGANRRKGKCCVHPIRPLSVWPTYLGASKQQQPPPPATAYTPLLSTPRPIPLPPSRVSSRVPCPPDQNFAFGCSRLMVLVPCSVRSAQIEGTSHATLPHTRGHMPATGISVHNFEDSNANTAGINPHSIL